MNNLEFEDLRSWLRGGRLPKSIILFVEGFSVNTTTPKWDTDTDGGLQINVVTFEFEINHGAHQSTA